MGLRKIAGDCQGGNCPALFATDEGTLIVQGNVVTDPDVLASLGLPSGETAVEIPAALLRGLPHAVTH